MIPHAWEPRQPKVHPPVSFFLGIRTNFMRITGSLENVQEFLEFSRKPLEIEEILGNSQEFTWNSREFHQGPTKFHAPRPPAPARRVVTLLFP